MIKVHGFWYVTAGYQSRLVIAANLEASKVKFKLQYADVVPLYIAPAKVCDECNKYKPPIDRDVQKLQYPDAEPCHCGHEHTTHFLGNAINEIANPLTAAQIN